MCGDGRVIGRQRVGVAVCVGCSVWELECVGVAKSVPWLCFVAVMVCGVGL